MPKYTKYNRLKNRFEIYLDAAHILDGSTIGLGMQIAIQTCIGILDAQPAADVAPVVRCRDCKFEKFCCRNIREGGHKPDDFCSFGVKEG